MRTVLSSKYTYIASFAAGLVLLLTACAGYLGKEGANAAVGGAAESLHQHGVAIQKEGETSGNPLQVLVGSVLSLVGAVGTTVTMIKRHDAAPFVGSDGTKVTEEELIDKHLGIGAATEAPAPVTSTSTTAVVPTEKAVV